MEFSGKLDRRVLQLLIRVGGLYLHFRSNSV